MSSWSHMKLVLSVALMSLKACGQRKAEYKLKQAIFRLQEQNKREITRLKETQIKCLILSVNSKQNDELSNITRSGCPYKTAMGYTYRILSVLNKNSSTSTLQ